jgi:hypothetical protein
MRNRHFRTTRGPKATARRKVALKNLYTQLTSDTKNTRDGHVHLSESDRARVRKEIKILEQRV